MKKAQQPVEKKNAFINMTFSDEEEDEDYDPAKDNVSSFIDPKLALILFRDKVLSQPQAVKGALLLRLKWKI